MTVHCEIIVRKISIGGDHLEHLKTPDTNRAAPEPGPGRGHPETLSTTKGFFRMKAKKFSKSNYLVLSVFLFRFSLPLFAPIFATQTDLLDEDDHHLQEEDQKSDLLENLRAIFFAMTRIFLLGSSNGISTRVPPFEIFFPPRFFFRTRDQK